MKSINKIFLLLLLMGGVVMTFNACEKESTGTPSIDYIRVSNPESSDSLLVAAGQGQLVAIVGKNLQDAVQVWFNDQASKLTPTYITNNTILVRVPSEIPLEINNQIKIVFKNGYTLYHDFEVEISKPYLASMVCEFVNDGDVATIRGNFFYAPVEVYLSDGTPVEIVSLEDKEIQFLVPAGAAAGPVTVKTNFGVVESDFWFRDNRNVIIGSDPYEGWHDPNIVISNPGAGDPPKINGNYIRVQGTLGSWSWNEIASGDAGSMPSYSKNIPDDAILNPEKYNLKFEINTLKPYNNSMIRINAGIYESGEADNTNYQWAPPYDSKGKWQTVVIPFDEIVNSYSIKPRVNPNGYWTRLLIQGPGDLDADICFDTFRVVPKVNK